MPTACTLRSACRCASFAGSTGPVCGHATHLGVGCLCRAIAQRAVLGPLHARRAPEVCGVHGHVEGLCSQHVQLGALRRPAPQRSRRQGPHPCRARHTWGPSPRSGPAPQSPWPAPQWWPWWCTAGVEQVWDVHRPFSGASQVPLHPHPRSAPAQALLRAWLSG